MLRCFLCLLLALVALTVEAPNVEAAPHRGRAVVRHRGIVRHRGVRIIRHRAVYRSRAFYASFYGCPVDDVVIVGHKVFVRDAFGLLIRVR